LIQEKRKTDRNSPVHLSWQTGGKTGEKQRGDDPASAVPSSAEVYQNVDYQTKDVNQSESVLPILRPDSNKKTFEILADFSAELDFSIWRSLLQQPPIPPAVGFVTFPPDRVPTMDQAETIIQSEWSGVMTLERRAWVRSACELEAACQPLASDPDLLWPARVQNICAGGTALRLSRPFKTGTLLKVEIQTLRKAFFRPILVQVANVTPHSLGGWLLSCEFLNNLAEDDLKTLTVGFTVR
jgi:hypothetical protein